MCVYVCVCVSERERESDIYIYIYIFIYPIYLCVCVRQWKKTTKEQANGQWTTQALIPALKKYQVCMRICVCACV
jgi:hypothetical protein